MSKELFKICREYDKEKIDSILILGTDEKGLGLALMNRVKKAASKIIINNKKNEDNKNKNDDKIITRIKKIRKIK